MKTKLKGIEKKKHDNLVKREMFARYKRMWAISFPNVEIKLHKKRIMWILRDHYQVIRSSVPIDSESLRYFMDLLEKNFTNTAIHLFCTTKLNDLKQK